MEFLCYLQVWNIQWCIWIFLFDYSDSIQVKLMYSSLFSFLNYVISDFSIWIVLFDLNIWCLFSFVVVFKKLLVVLNFVTILSSIVLHSIVALNFFVIFNRNKNREEEDFVTKNFLLIWKRGTIWIEIAHCETKRFLLHY